MDKYRPAVNTRYVTENFNAPFYLGLPSFHAIANVYTSPNFVKNYDPSSRLRRLGYR